MFGPCFVQGDPRPPTSKIIQSGPLRLIGGLLTFVRTYVDPTWIRPPPERLAPAPTRPGGGSGPHHFGHPLRFFVRAKFARGRGGDGCRWDHLYVSYPTPFLTPSVTHKLAPGNIRMSRSCAFCQTDPPEGKRFKVCPCKTGLRFCSVECQKKHWKNGHAWPVGKNTFHPWPARAQGAPWPGPYPNRRCCSPQAGVQRP